MSVECVIRFSDGREVKVSEPVSGGGREEFLDKLASSLSLVKENVNTILTEQVEKEKRVMPAPNKRETPEEDLEGTYAVLNDEVKVLRNSALYRRKLLSVEL